MTIAVTGATGRLGPFVIDNLKARLPSSEIVALARDSAKGARLGVTVREVDYERPETLATALTGVNTLLLISSSEVGRRLAQHGNVIDAARRTGVGRIVYTSLLRADTSPLSLAGEHRETETALKDSGLAYTILRHGWYTENYTASIPSVLAAGVLLGSAGEGRFSSATRGDYAEAAVVALLDDVHANRTYELAGDESYTLTELAAEVSRQAGRDIPYRDMPEGEYAAALVDAGLPEAIARSVAGWDVDAAGGALFDDGRQLSRLIGHPTTPLSVAVADALK